MNKKIQQILVLMVAILVVHTAFEFWISPNVQILERIAVETNSILPRNFFIIVKDLEQEVCIILFLWGLYLGGDLLLRVSSQSYLFDVDFLKDIQDPESDVIKTLDAIEDLPEDIKATPLVQTTLSSLRRFAITGSIQNAAEAIEPALDNMAIRNEGDISVLKYITWAIPSIGFLGTVRGIGQAMAQAEIAVAGDIGPMTSSLGVAFNSTFVALMISILLMMLLSFIQKIQDDQLLKVQDYCETYLIRRISLPQQENEET